MERQKTTVYLNLCTLLGLAGMACFIWYGVQNQIFVSAESLKHFLNQFGLFAPALFLVIQMIQVVLPILPGAVGCLGGVLILDRSGDLSIIISEFPLVPYWHFCSRKDMEDPLYAGL